MLLAYNINSYIVLLRSIVTDICIIMGFSHFQANPPTFRFKQGPCDLKVG